MERLSFRNKELLHRNGGREGTGDSGPRQGHGAGHSQVVLMRDAPSMRNPRVYRKGTKQR